MPLPSCTPIARSRGEDSPSDSLHNLLWESDLCARTAECGGEAWAEETELAKMQSGDRAQRFGKLKMNTRASSVRRVAGLFFHLFIHSFNKNSLSIYSRQALCRLWSYKHAFLLFREFTAFGIRGEECC